jgi:single-strand DNA-binding protein
MEDVMSEGLNRVMLLGNVGADPELRATHGGQMVLNLRLATTESYLDKNKVRQERTDWHSVVVWGARGEALGRILHKGSSVFVEGSLRTSTYDDREGNKRYKTEVVATNVLLTGRGDPGDAPAAEHDGGYGGDARGVVNGGQGRAPAAPPQGGREPARDGARGGGGAAGGARGQAGGGGGARGQAGGGGAGGRGSNGGRSAGGGRADAAASSAGRGSAAGPAHEDLGGHYGGGGSGDDDIPF